jgi:mRNA-degrading endonuclease YafQ of YafQ-DinJ toxin-antitoxin module
MPPTYRFDAAPGFFDKQRAAAIGLQLQLGAVLSRLAEDPVPDTIELRAHRLRDPRVPGGYTVSFHNNDALLTYQVREDLQVIRLLDLIWA